MNHITFDEWFEQLKAEARSRGYSEEAISSFDQEAWREYYEDQDTPRAALEDDESAGR